jgi:hypothetical protein
MPSSGSAVHEELMMALGVGRYERHDARRGYRNGIKTRTLTGPPGAAGAHAAPRHGGAGPRMALDDCAALSAPDACGERGGDRDVLGGGEPAADPRRAAPAAQGGAAFQERGLPGSSPR